MPAIRIFRRFIPAVGLVLACGGDDLLLPSDGEAGTVEVFHGNAQTGRVGEPLADSIVARVLDGQQLPVTGARVAFAFSGDGAGATVAPDTAATDADGLAMFQVTLGPRVGDGTAEVRVPTAGGQRILSAEVRFSAVSSDADQLAAVGGDDQSATVGARLANPLVVQVTDAFGNPISGVTIQWAAKGGGSVSATETATGDDGRTSVERTLGPNAGAQETTASAGGLAGSPVTFNHMASSGEATALEPVSGDGQSASPGSALPRPLVVRAIDAAGNPVADVPVTWVVLAGAGHLSPETNTTGDDGLASSEWTLGATPGTNSASAVSSGVGTVNFTARAEDTPAPGRAGTTTTVIGDDPDPSAPGVSVRVRYRVASSASGTPTGTVRVSSNHGASCSASPAAGECSLTLTTPGSHVLTAVYSGDSQFDGSQGSVPHTVTEPAPADTKTSIISDEPDPSDVGQPVTVHFTVTSSAGTPGGSVTVTAQGGGESCTGSVAAGACSLTLSAAGDRTLTATYSPSGNFRPSEDTEKHQVQEPPPPPPVPDGATSTIQVEHETVETDHRSRVTVFVRDAAGARLEHVNVVLTASGSGNDISPVSRTTDREGQAKFDFESSDPGIKTLTAVAGGVTLVDHPTITVIED